MGYGIQKLCFVWFHNPGAGAATQSTSFDIFTTQRIPHIDGASGTADRLMLMRLYLTINGVCLQQDFSLPQSCRHDLELFGDDFIATNAELKGVVVKQLEGGCGEAQVDTHATHTT